MGNTRYKNRPVFASGTKQKNVKPDEKNRTIYLEKKNTGHRKKDDR